MDFSDSGAQLVHQIPPRLDHEQPFRRVLYLALPAINTAHVRQNVDACREPLLDQGTRDLPGFLLGIAGGKHHDLVGHFLDFVWAEDASGHLSIFFRTASFSFGSSASSMYFK